MKKGFRIQISLAETPMEKLRELCFTKGLTRSAIVSLALEALYKQEKEAGNIKN